ncbi:hypothetical protein J1N35_014320, partial [Gossypium stocksii]
WNEEVGNATSDVIFCGHKGMVFASFTTTIMGVLDTPSIKALALSCTIKKALVKVNGVAHYLANWLMDENATLNFGLEYPDFIHRLVLDDIT